MQDLDGSRADAVLDGAERSWRTRLAAWLADAPPYPPNAGDLRTVTILGLALPVRATVAVLTVSLLVLLDYHGRINGLVDALLGPFGAGAARRSACSRSADWWSRARSRCSSCCSCCATGRRATGCGSATGGRGPRSRSLACALMTPVVLALARVEAFTSLLRAAGGGAARRRRHDGARGHPGGVLLPRVPPVRAAARRRPDRRRDRGAPVRVRPPRQARGRDAEHPVGGLLYGWLDWRTGSVVWSGLAHTWILSGIVLASAAAIAAG